MLADFASSAQTEPVSLPTDFDSHIICCQPTDDIKTTHRILVPQNRQVASFNIRTGFREQIADLFAICNSPAPATQWNTATQFQRRRQPRSHRCFMNKSRMYCVFSPFSTAEIVASPSPAREADRFGPSSACWHPSSHFDAVAKRGRGSHCN